MTYEQLKTGRFRDLKPNQTNASMSYFIGALGSVIEKSKDGKVLVKDIEKVFEMAIEYGEEYKY